MKNPGYTLYDGSYQRGAILVSSSFSKSPREVYSFGIIHMESGYPAYEFAAFPSFQPSSEEISLTVAIKTSTQAGYTIEDYDGKPVVSVPPGSFRGQSANVQEKHTVFRGVYFFSMIHNDGVILSDTSTDTCTYDVYVEANENRPPLLSGTPCLETERRQAFVLEGSYATIPVLVRVSGVLSGHFIFQIRRLDLSEADAVVATIRLDRETHVSDDSGLSSRFFVEDGGVYRLVPLGVSEHDQLTGSVRLTVGSHKNVIEADIIQQPKFLAGSDFHSTAPPINHAVSEKFLSLTIPTELGPSEIDWVLLSLNIENGKRIRRVISYGPGDKNNIRHYVLFSYSTVETIPLPSFDENPTLMLILSHSGGEDCCEQKSANGLIKLFQGPPEDGLILLGTTFEGESRLVEIFHLDTPGSPQSAANSIMNFGAAGRRGLLLLGSFLFVMFCYEL